MNLNEEPHSISHLEQLELMCLQCIVHLIDNLTFGNSKFVILWLL